MIFGYLRELFKGQFTGIDYVPAVAQIAQRIPAQCKLSKHQQIGFTTGLFDAVLNLGKVVFEISNHWVGLAKCHSEIAHKH